MTIPLTHQSHYKTQAVKLLGYNQLRIVYLLLREETPLDLYEILDVGEFHQQLRHGVQKSLDSLVKHGYLTEDKKLKGTARYTVSAKGKKMLTELAPQD